MSKSISVVLDFECLGVAENGNADSVVISCGLVAFPSDITWNDIKNKYNEYLDKSKYIKFSIKEQMPGNRFDRTVDPDTLAWWKSQDISVKKELAPSKEDEQLNVGVNQIIKYIKDNGGTPKTTKIYCKGQHFDIPLLASISYAVGVSVQQQIAKYWNMRDLRTAMDELIGQTDLKLSADIESSFLKHNAKHDVCHSMFELIAARALAVGDIEPIDLA